LDARPGATLAGIEAMEGDHFAYRATVYDAYGRRTFVHVNQWTGEVTGATHPLTVQRVFRDLHRYLFMPNYIGLPLVTSLAFVLAFSLYTGLKTARNWKTLMFRLRTGSGMRVMIGDGHKAAGLWASWFFVVIIVTGIWYLLEFGVGIGMKMTDADLSDMRPRLSQERVASFETVIKDRSFDEVVEAAHTAYPGLSITQIRAPISASAPFVVQGMVGNPFIRERANAVYLDPETLDVIQIHRAKEFPLFFYINEWADPLHFGFFGGLPTKLIWFAFGTAMTGLSLTGVWLTGKRLRVVGPSKIQFATMPVLVVSMVFATSWYDRLQGPFVPEVEQMLPLQVLPDGTVAALHIASDKAGEASGLVRLTLTSDHGRPAVKSITTQIGDIEADQRVRLVGRTVEARLLYDPAWVEKNALISFELTYLNGDTNTLTWR
ncbi:MAG: PepSY domain-containing protein, partial [Parvularculaceae bacterium]|nr:PepSY domain-containing protein [Parvularculaceae bacterium]